MDSIDDQGPFPPCPAPFNLARYVLWENGAPDEKTAMSVLSSAGARDFSYGQLRAAVLNAAGGLLASGLAPGKTVALRLGNTPDFPILFLGAIAAGIKPVPLSADLTPEEARRLLDLARPDAILGTDGTLDPEALAKGPKLAAFDDGDPDRAAYMVFTSGTSGQARAVVHAHRAIWARRAMHKGWYHMGADDRILHAGAFNWTYTLGTGLLDPWSLGATALVPGDPSDPADLPGFIKDYEATLFAAAPGVFRRMLRASLPSMPRLRHALSAGEKLPQTLVEKWKNQTGTEVYEAFGQSECSTFISSNPSKPAPLGTLGYTQPGRRCAILEDGAPVPRGTPGDIAIDARDPGLMLGYANVAEETNARMVNGWYLTGDQGVMQTDGAITYLGRSDDLLTAGGYRISPLEIENAAMAFPGIADAAAVDEKVNDETTLVALHYAAPNPIEAGILIAHMAEHLARYKQPRVFHHHALLPRGRGGKLLRVRLRTATKTT